MQTELKFPVKKVSAKDKKLAEAMAIEVMMKVIRLDFLNQWNQLTIHQKINIKCHQTFHIYSVYPNLLSDDIQSLCHRFQDCYRYEYFGKSCSGFKNVYNTYIK